MKLNVLRQSTKIAQLPIWGAFWGIVWGLLGACSEAKSPNLLKIIGGVELPAGHIGLQNTVGLATSNSEASPDSLPACSGFLVQPLWIITAAHCAANGTLKYVYFKNENLGETAEWRDVEKVILHPDWKGEGLFDLALVKYKALPQDMSGMPLNFKPVKILDEKEALALSSGMSMDIVGYGVSKVPSDTPPKKLHALVTIEKLWNDFFMAPGLITYSEPELRGACYGDSGGPAYAEINGNLRVIGITQGARGRYFNRMEKVECQDGKGIYTYLMPFRDWILKSVEGQLTASFHWEQLDPDFTSISAFCESAKKRDIWLAFYSLAVSLEEKTRTPMYGCDSFLKASSHLISLELTPWSKYSQVQPLLGSFSNLEELSIQDDNGGFSSDVDVGSLLGLTRLRKLVVDGPSLAHMDSLSQLKSLQYLDLFGTSEVPIETILALKNLNTLNLAGDAASNLESLGALPELQRLGTRRCVLDQAAIQSLFKDHTFPALKSADFSRCAVNYEALAKNEPFFKKFKPGTKFKFQKSLVRENVILQKKLAKNDAGVSIVFE